MSELNHQREEVFSKSVRAGKRTYFFDVKSTKSNDYYLTITESKKRVGNDGTPYYEKHKIFLYREDFEKFMEGMTEAFDKVNSIKSSEPQAEQENPEPAVSVSSYSDVNFEDLGK